MTTALSRPAAPHGGRIYTIGHSGHALADFVGLLRRHGVTAVADVRRFPGSRTHPQFGRDALAAALAREGVAYRWIGALGGRRRPAAGGGRNAGLRHPSFRAYADHMATPEFRGGIMELLGLAAAAPTAYLCSENVYWRCHRRLISDYLAARGVAVAHIMPGGGLTPHAMTPGAVVGGGGLTYPGG